MINLITILFIVMMVFGSLCMLFIVLAVIATCFIKPEEKIEEVYINDVLYIPKQNNE